MSDLLKQAFAGVLLILMGLLLRGFFVSNSAVARLDVKVDNHISSSKELSDEKVKGTDYKIDELKKTVEGMRADRKIEVDKLNKRLDNIMMLIQAYGSKRGTK